MRYDKCVYAVRPSNIQGHFTKGSFIIGLLWVEIGDTYLSGSLVCEHGGEKLCFHSHWSPGR